jgi:hypothetical protein
MIYQMTSGFRRRAERRVARRKVGTIIQTYGNDRSSATAAERCFHLPDVRASVSFWNG